MMSRFDSLILALEYIESILCEDIHMEELAKYALSSLSNLQKQFRWTFDYSIKEYISKRRLTAAARELVETEDSILEIAFRYGYHSPEVFTRAFFRMYQKNPSEYRREKKYVAVFPKIRIEETETGRYVVYKDVSALFDWLTTHRNVQAVCFDVVGLMEINKISRDAGDAVIMEAIRRINEVRGGNMPLFRLGGDEFALLLSDGGSDLCSKMERHVTGQNGQVIVFDDRVYPVVLRSWVGEIPDVSSLGELSATLIHSVKHA